MTPKRRDERPSKAVSHRRAAAPPRRADAQLNRARILDAAEVVFAARGAAGSTVDVARKAGVGEGTVFRHFPTKAALLEEVINGRIRRLVSEADLLVAANADAGIAFFGFFTRVVEEAQAKKVYGEVLAATSSVRRRPRIGQDLRNAVDLLLGNARRAGAVRADVEIDAVLALLSGLCASAEYWEWEEELRDRTLAVVFDGLRPKASRPVQARRPAARSDRVPDG